jgi:hypothetical protein
MAHKILSLWLLQAFVVHAGIPVEMFQRRQASPPEACSIVPYAISFCESASPGFDNFSPQSQAPCLCYNNTGNSMVWEPNIFDGAVLTCAEYLKTADPTDYSTFAELEGFCTSIGNVLEAGTPAITPTTPVKTSPPTTIQNPTAGPTTAAPTTAAPTKTGLTYPPCVTVGSIIDSCISATPAFTDLNNEQQASCVCYSGNTWNPNGFDVPILSCANYVQTAVPSEYSDFEGLEGFCTNYGAVSTQTRATVTPVVTTTPSIFISTPTTTANNRATVTVTPNAGPSFKDGGFRKLFSALAAVAIDMFLLF